MRLRWRKRDFAERLRPYLPERVAPERMVDADPIRMFLFRWMIETGDPVEVVAKGFDLPQARLQELLARSVTCVSGSEYSQLAERLGMNRAEARSSNL